MQLIFNKIKAIGLSSLLSEKAALHFWFCVNNVLFSIPEFEARDKIEAPKTAI